MNPPSLAVADVLAKWDAGEAIWSVQLGGIGPGYEQTIQVLIMELLRDNLTRPLPTVARASLEGDFS